MQRHFLGSSRRRPASLGTNHLNFHPHDSTSTGDYSDWPRRSDHETILHEVILTRSAHRVHASGDYRAGQDPEFAPSSATALRPGQEPRWLSQRAWNVGRKPIRNPRDFAQWLTTRMMAVRSPHAFADQAKLSIGSEFQPLWFVEDVEKSLGFKLGAAKVRRHRSSRGSRAGRFRYSSRIVV